MKNLADNKIPANPAPAKKPWTPAQAAFHRLLRIYLYSIGVGAATFALGNLGSILEILKNFHGLQAWVITAAASAMGGPIIESTLKFFRARLAEEQKAQEQADQ